MRTVFIDTGAFVALRNASEQEHESARATLSGLVAEGAMLVTSNYVVAETYTALLVRVGYAEAIEWGRRLRSGTSIERVHLDEAIEQAAWTILESHSDKRWSFVDATSFALIERESIDTAFAFDHHFRQRGLSVLPV